MKIWAATQEMLEPAVPEEELKASLLQQILRAGTHKDPSKLKPRFLVDLSPGSRCKAL